MRRIRWTPAAVADLEALIDYIHQDDPVAAEALAQRIFDGLERLCGFPGIGRPGDEHGTRELIVYPLIVLYRVGDDFVEPIRIWHGAQRRQ